MLPHSDKCNGGMESSGGCGSLDRGLVMTSLMRMLEQSCEGVNPAGLRGQSVSAGGNSECRGPGMRACLEC